MGVVLQNISDRVLTHRVLYNRESWEMAEELTIPTLKEAKERKSQVRLSYMERLTKQNKQTKTPEGLNSISPIICKVHKIHKEIPISLIIIDKNLKTTSRCSSYANGYKQ